MKGTVGKQVIKPFFCPICQEQLGEQQVGSDMYCGKGQHRIRITTLCYKCGFSESTIVNTRLKEK